MEKKRYGTVREFCEDRGLDNRIEIYVEELNKLWIKGASDPKSFRKHLQERWKGEGFTVKGICPWITDLAELGSRIKPPVVDENGVALIIKSEERDELLKKLKATYEDIILASLRFSATDVDSRVDRVFNRYSIHLMRALSAKLKLIWALLGYSTEDCNLDYYFQGEGLVEANLLPLLKANARAKRNPVIPERVVEIENAELKLLAQ
jgi:hypothetical protein